MHQGSFQTRTHAAILLSLSHVHFQPLHIGLAWTNRNSVPRTKPCPQNVSYHISWPRTMSESRFCPRHCQQIDFQPSHPKVGMTMSRNAKSCSSSCSLKERKNKCHVLSSSSKDDLRGGPENKFRSRSSSFIIVSARLNVIMLKVCKRYRLFKNIVKKTHKILTPVRPTSTNRWA